MAGSYCDHISLNSRFDQHHILCLSIAKDGNEVLEFVKKDKVDLILMDISMPIMNGIICTKKIKKIYPEIKIIIITMYNRKKIIQDSIEAGADGYMLKNNSGKELLTAIKRVFSGKTYFDDLNHYKDSPLLFQENKLGDREIEIIGLISEGYSSKQIADKLYISEHTVKTHRKNIFRKINVTSADQLIRWAMNSGLF